MGGADACAQLAHTPSGLRPALLQLYHNEATHVYVAINSYIHINNEHVPIQLLLLFRMCLHGCFYLILLWKKFLPNRMFYFITSQYLFKFFTSWPFDFEKIFIKYNKTIKQVYFFVPDSINLRSYCIFMDSTIIR